MRSRRIWRVCSAERGRPRGLGIVRCVAGGLGAHASTLIRVEAEIPHKMRPGVGDVLGELGDEVQRVEDLEVAGDPRTDAAEEVTAGGLGEVSAGFLLGEVDHCALLGDADHPIETERASEHVLGETLATGEVVGVQPHRMMDAEARVVPAEHLRDDGRIDLVLLEQQVEDLLLPERLEGVGIDARKFDASSPKVWMAPIMPDVTSRRSRTTR